MPSRGLDGERRVSVSAPDAPAPLRGTSISSASSPKALGILIAVSAAVAGALTLAVTVVFPLQAKIAVPFSLAGLDPEFVGLLFWIGVCLLTSSRGSLEEGRVSMSLGLGPAIAAAYLGGPAAAAWVAIVGTTELREIRGDVPWYGVLGNHAALTIAFTAMGLVMWVLRAVAASGPELDLAVVFLATTVGFSINMALASLTVSLRTGRSAAAGLAIGIKGMALIYGAETSLAWIVAQAYVLVAWWSPVLFVIADAAAGGSLDRHRAGWQLRHHQVTELPNGVALRDYARELRGSPPSGMCVFYIDLDGFKAINDDHGHLAGDDVLRIVGRRLEDAAREGDFVAHLHGDEFVVLARGVADDRAARAIAGRLVAAVEPPMTYLQGDLTVSATVGHHLVADLGGLHEAIRNADRSMSEAKNSKAQATGRARRRS